jgi:hypothetical protein
VNLGSSEAGLKLQCDWILKDSDSVNELQARIARVADAENYQHDIQTLENNKVRVEVWTPSIGLDSSACLLKRCCNLGAELIFADRFY